MGWGDNDDPPAGWPSSELGVSIDPGGAPPVEVVRFQVESVQSPPGSLNQVPSRLRQRPRWCNIAVGSREEPIEMKA